jgi:hypothetical protein
VKPNPRLPSIPDPRPLSDDQLAHVAETARMFAERWRTTARLREYAPDHFMAASMEWVADFCSAVLEDRAAAEIEAHLAEAKE